MKKINKGKIAKFTVWFIVLALSVAGDFIAMYYGMEVIYRILSKVIGIALVVALLFAAMMVFLETYLAKHPNPLQHEIDRQKAQQELKEEMDKRFK